MAWKRKHRRTSWLNALAALAILVAGLAITAVFEMRSAIEISGTARVIDGDSLRLDGRSLRLSGLDAPELAQTCTDGSGIAWPCGAAARTALAGLAEGPLECRLSGRDRYRRHLAVCRTEAGLDVARFMVQQGLAIATSPELFGAEREARTVGRGLWVGDFEAPAAWRARHGGADVGDEPAPRGLLDWIEGLFGAMRS